jgi:hypothetical protein
MGFTRCYLSTFKAIYIFRKMPTAVFKKICAVVLLAGRANCSLEICNFDYKSIGKGPKMPDLPYFVKKKKKKKSAQKIKMKMVPLIG